MPETAKKKVEESVVGATASVNPTQPQIRLTPDCVNPAAGKDQVIAYISGDLIGKECKDFVAHVGECHFCLREVVSWRVAQALAANDYKSSSGRSHYPRKVQPPMSLGVTQSSGIVERDGVNNS